MVCAFLATDIRETCKLQRIVHLSSTKLDILRIGQIN